MQEPPTSTNQSEREDEQEAEGSEEGQEGQGKETVAFEGQSFSRIEQEMEGNQESRVNVASLDAERKGENTKYRQHKSGKI
jgi:hypothetical protein